MSAPRSLWLLPLVASLVIACGCHSVHPCPELLEPCHSLPRCCREHVHVFLINGLDPLNYANLTGLREYLIELGFNNTHHGQLYHTGHFVNEIRRIRGEDPEARFVVVGFSFGANAGRYVVNTLRDEQAEVDLLVYLGGNTLGNTPRDRPANAHRVVNILALGCIWNGAQLDDAENVQVNDVYHFGSPTHQATLEMFARELAEVASRIPFVAGDESVSTSGKLSPEWSFLAPATALQPVPAREGSTAAPAADAQPAGSVKLVSMKKRL